MSDAITVAVIGGSGLAQLPDFQIDRKLRPQTPYGLTSDAVLLGQWAGRRVAFLPRHGRGHRLLPSEVPNRANICALKSIGVQRVIAVSAVGSMHRVIRPLDIVLPDQLIDNTRHRASTFFGDGVVGHVNLSEPICPDLLRIVHTACTDAGARVHRGGTYHCEEGPQFPTRAEAEAFRARADVSVIGMTAAPEMKLAREAALCYALICVVTDFAPWHAGEPLSTDLVVANMRKMGQVVQRILTAALQAIPDERGCDCGHALEGAIQTEPSAVTRETRERMRWLIGD